MGNFLDLLFPIKCVGCYRNRGPICADCKDKFKYIFEVTTTSHQGSSNCSQSNFYIHESTPFTENVIKLANKNMDVFLKEFVQTLVQEVVDCGFRPETHARLVACKGVYKKYNEQFANELLKKCKAKTQRSTSTYGKNNETSDTRIYAITLKECEEFHKLLGKLSQRHTQITGMILIRDDLNAPFVEKTIENT